MKLVATLIMTMIIFSTFSQNRERIQNVISNEKGQSYQRFGGKITVKDDNTFLFDDKFLFVTNTENKLKEIFKNGLLYPRIFGGITSDEHSKTKEQVKLSEKRDTAAIRIVVKDKLSFLFNIDSLRISDLKEVKSAKVTPKSKRLEFLLFRKGLMNPTSYTVELTNDNASEETDIVTFIKGARLTNIIIGSILI